MNIVEAMERRHAVRDFSDRPIDDDTLRALNEAVDAANADGGLDVQLVQDDTDAFGHSWTARSAITASALP